MVDKHPTICIIEDNARDREIFHRYLLQDTSYQYQFFDAETGAQGLELCRAVQPDCILLDYNLPDTDGLEFLAELADESGSVPFTVVMLAGLEDESIALRAMKRGAQDYLVKDEMTAGNLFRAIHNAIERTAMRRLVEQQRRDLEQKNQEMQAFAYALAHDLRAPLRAITGFAQIVAQDYHMALDGDGQHYIEKVVQASARMDRLIENLLNYTRIEHRTVRNKPVALETLITQIVADLQPRVLEKQAIITLAGNLPMVCGDPILLNQIFVNLFENALTYLKPGRMPQISLDWFAEKEHVVVRLSDNGIGIDPRQQERIFTIFQRLHGEELYPGTGIGLALVRKATELMGGHVWVEAALDKGSTFYVKLPEIDKGSAQFETEESHCEYKI